MDFKELIKNIEKNIKIFYAKMKKLTPGLAPFWDYCEKNIKIILPGFIILLLLLIPPSRNLLKYNLWDPAHITSEYFFKTGVRYEEKKYINYAIGSFKRALKLHDNKFNIEPGDLYQVESLFNLGVLYYQNLKNYPQAIYYFSEYMDIFNKLKAVNPNVKNVHEEEILKVVNFMLAIDDSSKNPQARILKNKGNDAYFKKDFTNALNYYKDSLKLDPSYVEVYNNIATTYFELGDFRNAVDFWKMTLLFMTDLSNPETFQETLSLYINIALACEEHLKKYDDAVYYYEKYIEKVPPDDPGLNEAKARIERIKSMQKAK